MAAPKFAPVPAIGDIKSYRSPAYVPDPWMPDRPGDLDGGQPSGPRLGYQGPDQGYALVLANRLAPQLVVADDEDIDDVVKGCTAIALRRASMFGRAPVIHDLRIAFTIWGFLDPAPPADLVALRVKRFEGAGHPHHYEVARALADEVPASTLQMNPDKVAAAYRTEWRRLLGLDASVLAASVADGVGSEVLEGDELEGRDVG
jgi:hypothetical protein